jgi:dTDP-4-amino-4,6-dideoxygalactose transaminase
MMTGKEALALLGGKPARIHRRPRFPVFSERARERVDEILRQGDSVGLGKLHPLIAEAEDTLAAWHGVEHCLGTATGFGSLHAAMIGLEITDGDEVVTSPYSWGASVSCILANGAVPVFADVHPGTGLLDPSAVERRISDRTRGILVPHIYGQPADLTRLREICDRRGLTLIEDGSQAHGARHRGRRVGSFGDASGFSAMGGKLLATTEAGYLLTNRADVYWKAVLSCQHAGGTEHPGRSSEPGFPEELQPYIDSLIFTYRLSTINAVLLVEQLTKLDEENANRARNRDQLRDLLKGVRSLEFPTCGEGDVPVYHIMTMNFDAEAAGIRQETYRDALRAEGVPVFSYVATPLHKALRLDPDCPGPRVMWRSTMRAARADAATAELPGCDAKVAHSLELSWNYIEPNEEGMRSIADAIIKVEERLDDLVRYERRQ